uniref:Uncharacterized protein n=1 Tax=Panagrolaimus sp. ES5 TaxID=591445 RepID=A0AC34FS39_9BILA
MSVVALKSPSLSIKFPNYHDFRASSRQQIFSIPESIVLYMAKNPKLTIKFYQKIVKTCKYVFIENPIIHFHCLQFDDENGWQTCIDNRCERATSDEPYCEIDMDLNKLQAKINVDFDLGIDSTDPTIASSLIPKLNNGKNIFNVYNTARISIHFDGPLSDSYKAKLQEITNEILDAPEIYDTTYIRFDGQLRFDEFDHLYLGID